MYLVLPPHLFPPALPPLIDPLKYSQHGKGHWHFQEEESGIQAYPEKETIKQGE